MSPTYVTGIVPARLGNVAQLVMKEPVGPVAAFTPWNFPINQAVRKISAALAAGCSIIVKGPEETPASCIDKAKFRKAAPRRHARIKVAQRRNMWWYRGEAKVGGVLVAEAELGAYSVKE